MGLAGSSQGPSSDYQPPSFISRVTRATWDKAAGAVKDLSNSPTPVSDVTIGALHSLGTPFRVASTAATAGVLGAVGGVQKAAGVVSGNPEWGDTALGASKDLLQNMDTANYQVTGNVSPEDLNSALSSGGGQIGTLAGDVGGAFLGGGAASQAGEMALERIGASSLSKAAQVGLRAGVRAAQGTAMMAPGRVQEASNLARSNDQLDQQINAYKATLQANPELAQSSDLPQRIQDLEAQKANVTAALAKGMTTDAALGGALFSSRLAKPFIGNSVGGAIGGRALKAGTYGLAQTVAPAAFGDKVDPTNLIPNTLMMAGYEAMSLPQALREAGIKHAILNHPEGPAGYAKDFAAKQAETAQAFQNGQISRESFDGIMGFAKQAKDIYDSVVNSRAGKKAQAAADAKAAAAMPKGVGGGEAPGASGSFGLVQAGLTPPAPTAEGSFMDPDSYGLGDVPETMDFPEAPQPQAPAPSPAPVQAPEIQAPAPSPVAEPDAIDVEAVPSGADAVHAQAATAQQAKSVMASTVATDTQADATGKLAAFEDAVQPAGGSHATPEGAQPGSAGSEPATALEGLSDNGPDRGNAPQEPGARPIDHRSDRANGGGQEARVSALPAPDLNVTGTPDFKADGIPYSIPEDRPDLQARWNDALEASKARHAQISAMDLPVGERAKLHTMEGAALKQEKLRLIDAMKEESVAPSGKVPTLEPGAGNEEPPVQPQRSTPDTGSGSGPEDGTQAPVSADAGQAPAGAEPDATGGREPVTSGSGPEDRGGRTGNPADSEVQGHDAGRGSAGVLPPEERGGPELPDGSLRGEGRPAAPEWAIGPKPPVRVWHGTEGRFNELKAEGLSRNQIGGFGPGLHYSVSPDVAERYAGRNKAGIWKAHLPEDYTPFNAMPERTYSTDQLDQLGVEASHPMTGEEAWTHLASRLGEQGAVDHLESLGFDGLAYAHGADAYSVWKNEHVGQHAQTTMDQAQGEASAQPSRRDALTNRLLESATWQPGDTLKDGAGKEYQVKAKGNKGTLRLEPADGRGKPVIGSQERLEGMGMFKPQEVDTSAGRVHETPDSYTDGTMEIPSGTHFDDLKPEQQQAVVEGIERDITRWHDAPDAFQKEYAQNPETHGGRLVNGDIVFSMIPTVAKNIPLGRAAGKKVDSAILSYIMTLTKGLRQQAYDLAGDKPVAITAGGQASGKTTLANKLLDDGSAGAVIDAPHDDARTVKRIAEEALGLKKDVEIYFVDRPDFRAAFKDMIRRAIREGRFVGTQDMTGKHVRVPMEMLKIGDEFRNSYRVGLFHARTSEKDHAFDVAGGLLAHDGKDALSSIRNRPSPSAEDLDSQAREAYLDYLKGVQNGTEIPIPADLRRDIEASIPGLDTEALRREQPAHEGEFADGDGAPQGDGVKGRGPEDLRPPERREASPAHPTPEVGGQGEAESPTQGKLATSGHRPADQEAERGHGPARLPERSGEDAELTGSPEREVPQAAGGEVAREPLSEAALESLKADLHPAERFTVNLLARRFSEGEPSLHLNTFRPIKGSPQVLSNLANLGLVDRLEGNRWGLSEDGKRMFHLDKLSPEDVQKDGAPTPDAKPDEALRREGLKDRARELQEQAQRLRDLAKRLKQAPPLQQDKVRILKLESDALDLEHEARVREEWATDPTPKPLPTPLMGIPGLERSGDEFMVPTKELHADPARFQYKRRNETTGVNQVNSKTGASGSLHGVKVWNKDSAGVLSVWRDPADGKVYVVNGHNRYDKALELGVPALKVRFLDAKNAKDAQSMGALQNISEGAGTPVDAALLLRDGHMDLEDLEKAGVPTNKAVVRDGLSLSNLSDAWFHNAVADPEIERLAVETGKTHLDPEQQDLALRELQHQIERKGGADGISNAFWRDLLDRIKGSSQVKTGATNLFGEEEYTSTLEQQADIIRYIRSKLGLEKRAGSLLSSAKHAEVVDRAASVDREAAHTMKQEASTALEIFEQQKHLTGIGDIINDYAEKLARAGSTKDAEAIKHRAIEEVRKHLGGLHSGGVAESGQEDGRLVPGGSELSGRSAQPAPGLFGEEETLGSPGLFDQTEEGHNGTDRSGERGFVNAGDMADAFRSLGESLGIKKGASEEEPTEEELVKAQLEANKKGIQPVDLSKVDLNKGINMALAHFYINSVGAGEGPHHIPLSGRPLYPGEDGPVIPSRDLTALEHALGYVLSPSGVMEGGIGGVKFNWKNPVLDPIFKNGESPVADIVFTEIRRSDLQNRNRRFGNTLNAGVPSALKPIKQALGVLAQRALGLERQIEASSENLAPALEVRNLLRLRALTQDPEKRAAYEKRIAVANAEAAKIKNLGQRMKEHDANVEALSQAMAAATNRLKTLASKHRDVRAYLVAHYGPESIPEWLSPLVKADEKERGQIAREYFAARRADLQAEGVPVREEGTIHSPVARVLPKGFEIPKGEIPTNFDDPMVDPEDVRFAHRKDNAFPWCPSLVEAMDSYSSLFPKFLACHELAERWQPALKEFQEKGFTRLTKDTQDLLATYIHGKGRVPILDAITNYLYFSKIALSLTATVKHSAKGALLPVQVGPVAAVKGVADAMQAMAGTSEEAHLMSDMRATFLGGKDVTASIQAMSNIPLDEMKGFTKKAYTTLGHFPVSQTEWLERSATLFASLEQAIKAGKDPNEAWRSAIGNALAINFMGVDKGRAFRGSLGRTLFPFQQTRWKLFEYALQKDFEAGRASRDAKNGEWKGAAKKALAASSYWAMLAALGAVSSAVLGTSFKKFLTEKPEAVKAVESLTGLEPVEAGKHVFGSLFPQGEEAMENSQNYGLPAGLALTGAPIAPLKLMDTPDNPKWGRTPEERKIRSLLGLPLDEEVERQAQGREMRLENTQRSNRRKWARRHPGLVQMAPE